MTRGRGRPEGAGGRDGAPALPVRIREAAPADARACAEVHVEGWRWAYRGLLPDGYLDRVSVEDRERTWREGVAGSGERVAWVAEREGRVIGLCVTGPSEDADADRSTAEVYAIYLLPEVVGTGVGRALLDSSTPRSTSAGGGSVGRRSGSSRRTSGPAGSTSAPGGGRTGR